MWQHGTPTDFSPSSSFFYLNELSAGSSNPDRFGLCANGAFDGWVSLPVGLIDSAWLSSLDLEAFQLFFPPQSFHFFSRAGGRIYSGGGEPFVTATRNGITDTLAANRCKNIRHGAKQIVFRHHPAVLVGRNVHDDHLRTPHSERASRWIILEWSADDHIKEKTKTRGFFGGPTVKLISFYYFQPESSLPPPLDGGGGRNFRPNWKQNSQWAVPGGIAS